MEINKNNAWDLFNYFYSNELSWFEKYYNLSIPENIDESILFLTQNNMTDQIIYKLLILKKELLTGESEANASPQP